MALADGTKLDAFDETLRPRHVTGHDHADFHTPSPAQVKKTPAYYKCAQRLREMNLDDLGFEVHEKTTSKSFLVHSPCKQDGSAGRTYVLGSDRLRRRVTELDKDHGVAKCTPVAPYRGIGLSPPKKRSRRALEPALQEVQLYNVVDSTEASSSFTQVYNAVTSAQAASSLTQIYNAVAPTEVSSSVKQSRGAYVPMLDPYMLGSTDYAEAMEFLQHVVCGKRQADGSVCGGVLQDLHIPRGTTRIHLFTHIN